MNAKSAQSIGLLALAGGALYLTTSCIYTGLKDLHYKEGWNFRIPYFERPIIFNIQTRPTTIRGLTANRVLYRPKADKLTNLYKYCGSNYDERVLPSLVNEVLKAVVAQYSASQLLSQRDQVSNKIRRSLEERASNFFIVIDDVSIVDLAFTKEYAEAVEAKQVAQQDAERAKFLVEKAREYKKSIIIKAQGESRSIDLVGKAAMDNPAYLDLRRIEYAVEISNILAQSRNSAYLDASSLLLNVNQITDTKTRK